ncbi:tRNA(Ile)-lysidine synthase [mine drainage metagenome]|uniref:tRNA(Ile)-lysidine synthetase n=1 Tax=mine drainage metagenome TaxID=410659 RepID=T0YFH2_9ZZZZ
MTKSGRFSSEYLSRLLAPLNARKLWVACSGGVDSMTLLHALATRRDLFPMPIGAIHVNHHWHRDAGNMESLVRKSAETWGAQFIAVSIDQPPVHRGGLEAVSRKLRYQGMASHLAAGEVLLTAHHANDQLETMLLALLRGSGLQGLRGMVHGPRPFGLGQLMRPLLQFSRAELLRYASALAVPWFEDPTNRDLSRARNYLRHTVISRIEERWPGACQSADVSACFLEESFAFLDHRLEHETSSVWNPCWNGLIVEALRKLPESGLRLLLRRWIRVHHHSASTLSRTQMESLMHVIRKEPQTRHASFALKECEIVLYAGHLFLVPALPEPRVRSTPVTWDPDTRHWHLWPGWGTLYLTEGSPTTLLGRDASAWHISLRSGGEQMAWHRNAGHHPLKEIFRSERVPPWMRNRIPLVFAGTELVAAGDWFCHPDLLEGRLGSDERPLVWEPDHADLLYEKQRYDDFLSSPRAHGRIPPPH